MLRLPSVLAAAALLGATSLQAQHPAPPAAPASSSSTVRQFLDSLRRDPNGVALAPTAVSTGARTVRPDETVTGDVASWHGPLDVYGTVSGNAVAIGGDVIVHQGATVRGDALSIGGKVRLDGGTIEGEMRTLSALSVGAAHAPLTRAQATKRSLSIAVGWYLVLAAMAVAVALFARTNLEVVSDTVRAEFTRSFLYGVIGELALAPVFLLSIVALAITIVGILAIPIVAAAYVLGAAGALALGFLAMSYVTGDAALRRRDLAASYAASPVMQYLLIGLSLYFALWMLGGAFAWAGLLGGLVRLLAAVVTWVAVTVGFGAVILTRAGTRTPRGPVPRLTTTTEEYVWQTPTPVTGVAAARRPTPAARSPER